MRFPLPRACLIFGRSGRGGGVGGTSPNIFQKKKNFYLWVHVHNLIKQNNNFSILKKIENPLISPLKCGFRKMTLVYVKSLIHCWCSIYCTQ